MKRTLLKGFFLAATLCVAPMLQAQDATHDGAVCAARDTLTMVASRGGVWRGGRAPENSLYALVSAADRGVRVVAVDVRPTLDGKYVVMHDRTLNRTCLTARGEDLAEAKVRVDGLTLEQIKNCRFDTPNVQMRIAPSTLEEFAAYCVRLHVMPMLLLQPRSDVRKVLEIIERVAGNNFIIVCSDIADVQTALHYVPACVALWRLPDTKKELSKLQSRDVLYELEHLKGACGVSVAADMATPELLREVRRGGYLVQLEVTADTVRKNLEARLDAAKKTAPSFILTDF